MNNDTITLSIAVNWIFIILIGILLIIDIRTYRKDGARNHISLSGQMTGLGILGTFLGIVIGLQELNFSGGSDTAKTGIAYLLEGVKTSFVTSVAGLTAALTTEIVQKCKPQIYAKDGNEVADTLKDFMALMESSFSDLKQTNQDVASSMDDLKSEMTSESVKTRDALEQAIESLSKGASEEIISALQGVIKDFNQNLTDQFGENFKQLNLACLELVQWQQDYQQSITESRGALETSSAAMQECSKQFEASLERKQEFLDVVSSTKDGIDGLNQAQESSVKFAKEQAEEVKRQTEANILMAEQHKLVLTAQSDSLEYVQTASQSCSQQLKELVIQFNELATQSQAYNENSLSGLEVNNEQFKLAKEMADHIASKLDTLAGKQSEVTGSIESTVKSLAEGNANLHSNLDQSLSELESALSSLTRDFSKAYNQYLTGLKRLSQTS